jgi:transcription initiation factor TFIID subunit 1
VLDTADKSPFLGDIKAGSSQSSLETNMYRAPIFSHKVPSTDYLLVRSAKGKLSIRRIDRVDVVGQQVASAVAFLAVSLQYFIFGFFS